MIFGKKKPLRDKELRPSRNKSKYIIKCIGENAPLDFKFCKNCEYTSQCRRLRKKVIL